MTTLSTTTFSSNNLCKTKRIALIGSTGSIGTQTLDVVRAQAPAFHVVALAAGQNLHLLADQVHEFSPEAVCIADETRVDELKSMVPEFSGAIFYGETGLSAIAAWSTADTVMFGISGMIGLEPTLTALKAGKKVLTANKETFVAGGHLVKPYLDQIIPIDSEHSAIFQCLHGERRQDVKKLILTASGGPFRTWTKEQISNATREQALRHPNWTMGQKITIDSATMMNKGLEVIEAHWLFGLSYDQIEVVIHPQSIVHSFVEFVDGSILAQLGAPDMKVPIQYAMTYPERWEAPSASSQLDWQTLNELTFEQPDLDKFPCLALAYEAGRLGPEATAVLNAADEVAVKQFLDGQITFGQIYTQLRSVVRAKTPQAV